MAKFGELVGLRTGDDPIRVGLGVLLPAAMTCKRRREGAIWWLPVRTTRAVAAREGRGDYAALAAVAAVGLGLAVYALAVSRREAETGREDGWAGDAIAGAASAERMAGEGTPHDLKEGARAVRLRRDFGIVAPDQHLKHRFGIHNSSAVDGESIRSRCKSRRTHD